MLVHPGIFCPRCSLQAQEVFVGEGGVAPIRYASQSSPTTAGIDNAPTRGHARDYTVNLSQRLIWQAHLESTQAKSYTEAPL